MNSEPMNNESHDPEEGEERQGSFTCYCPNCGYASYEQFVFSEGKWELYGWQCKTCWRTYYVGGGYSY